MMVHHNVIDIDQPPTGGCEIEGDALLLTGKSDDLVEPSDRVKCLPADHRRTGQEPEKRRAGKIRIPARRRVAHAFADRIQLVLGSHEDPGRQQSHSGCASK